MLRILFISALLAAGAPAMAEQPKRDAPEKVADSGDKMICKRFTETGSLVKSYRTCKTKAEWERERENIRMLNPTASCGQESCN
jgi:hypothetical protein